MTCKTIYRFALLGCILWWCGNAIAQNAVTDELKRSFNAYSANNFTEKIYLHVDRNFYVSGEILWFKAYVTDGVVGYTSDISKLAYVEIIDKDDKPFLQVKTALTNGLGNGSFYLPGNMPSGRYKIRAYTNWMKNFDAGFYFEKAITIVNALTDDGLPVVDTTSLYDAQFFPEGGNLVNSIESKIAFRVTDKKGKGVQGFSGVVIADNKDTVARFSPLHAGIGTFLFTPLSGHQYNANLYVGSKLIVTKKLPAILNDGFAMTLSKSSSTITIKVQSNTSPGSNDNKVYLFAQTKGVVKSVETQSIQNGAALFSIDENILGEGITHFTVFNNQQQPVCERLYFKRPADKLQLAAQTSKQDYTTREKVLVNINSEGIANDKLSSNISLSIYRLDGLQAPEQADIYSYLWLSADLKGIVETPAYYFNNNNDTTNEALDNLMLTHGWRRFKWVDVQQNKKPLFEFLPEFEGPIITGKLTDTFTHKPFAETAVYLAVPGEYTQFYSAKTDDKGDMRFYTRNVYGPGELVTLADALQDTKYNIDINTPFSDKFSAEKLPVLSLSPALKTALETNSINTQVQRKYFSEMLKKYRLPQIDTSAFYGRADERYPLDDYTRFTTMEEVLREFVLGVLVGRSGGKFHLTVFDIPNNRLFRDNPLVLLDGVPVLNMEQIMSYDPLKVRKVEVVKRRYYFGAFLFDGIVNFVTYKGNLEEFQMDPHAVIMDFEGMQLQREFYEPVYETSEQINSHTADFRNLLYWSPDIHTDSTGNAQVQFYTSDLKGKYLGVMEGITPNGKAGSTTFTFEVSDRKK
ncbi:MAG: hypothetical protein QM802_24980 [Agriterribacter sp.]